MKALFGVVVVLAVGCAPLDGYPCDKLEERRCDGPTKVAYCESTNLGGKKWKAYDCPAGCGGDKCPSWKGVVDKAPCPPSEPGSWCDADGHVFVCSTSFSRDGGADTARWEAGDCPLCKKDTTLAESGRCVDGGLCYCQ